MELSEVIAVVMVVAVCGLLIAGYPVALTLAGVSLAFAALGHFTGVMSIGLLGALPERIFGVMTNEVLLAIPLFIFMGVMLERSRIAEELLETMGRLFGSWRGGLGISVAIVGALLAAAKGVVGATTVTMGLITLPTMLRYGYDPRLAAGTVAATSTLAQIMPPATVLVVLGDQLNNSYQAAQLASGIFAPSSLSVGDLFAGAIVPALTLVALYIVYLIVVAFVRPEASPPIPAEPGAPRGVKLARRVIEAMVAPVLLIVAVLGSILAGLATPTESAAVGAFGALALTARKIDARAWPVTLGLAAIVAALVLHGFVDVRLNRAPAGLGGQIALAVALALVAIIAIGAAMAVRIVWRHGILVQVTARTTQITAMIFLILIGATLFSLVFRGLGGDEMVHRALADLPGGTGGAVLAVMVAMFLLGFVMDVFEIVFVVVPIVAPVLLRMEGVDPVWLGVMMAVNLQTSFMHPPLGPTLFYLRSVAPPGLTTKHIYLGIIPYVAIQLACLVVLWFVPGLATVLPNALYRR
ncbi:MAG TPA: TRAP transporter large permease subunit [Xanthobacteraceae bacterium]|jgi:tripartite ATP-independent transporter DctM subunit|nr:TRAP transporter large permease subunit [Xanthobacteraceae bacterium]